MNPSHTFTSPLPLMVGWIEPDGAKDPAGGGEHKLGATTVGGRSVKVPECRVWYVEPRHGMDDVTWDQVIEEVGRQKIPGLSVGKQIDDITLARVGALEHLQYLDLSGCTDITDQGLLQLGRLSNLRRLHLVNCKQITDAGLAVLRSFPNLCVVRLDRMPAITDAGIAHLADHTNLQMVTMHVANVGDGAIRALASKPSLTHFAPGNLTTDDGLAILPKFPALAEWGDDRQTFQNNEYGPPVPSCLSFDLRGGMPITDAGVAHLAGLQGVFEMGLAHQLDDSTVSGAGAEYVARMGNVRILRWAEKVCDSEALSHIGKMSSLRDLICFNATADDEGFTALEGCDSLKYILAQRCDFITRPTVEAFSKLPNLTRLNVGGERLDDDDLEPLSRYPVLEEFWPTFFGDAAYRHVGQVTDLERLVNMYCKETGDEATEHISDLQELRKYHVWGTQITDRSLELMGQMNALESVLFWNCPHLTDEGISRLTRLPSLANLDLQKCEGLTVACVEGFRPEVRVNYQPAS